MPAVPANPATAQLELEPPPPPPPPPRPANSTKESSAVSTPPTAEVDDSGDENDEEDSMPTPTLPSLNSSAVSFSSSASSPSISPSSSISTNTSVASDTHRGLLGSDQHIHEEYKAAEQGAGLNNDTIVAALESDVDADLNHFDTTTTTTTAPMPVPSPPSTPASSSSASLPAPTPYDSSTPTSASPSTTNINDLGVDPNGPMSLLRPRLQINNQSLNVKFAPLPELAPRKRKSNTPLGMAARSQLARRRRMMYQDSYDDDGTYEDSRRFNHPEISEEADMEAGVDGMQHNGVKKKTKKKKKDGEDGEKNEKVKKEGEQDDEDPLAALAKKMGRAGKHLWKRMASGGKTERDGAGEDGKKVTTEPVVVFGTIASNPEQREEEGQGQGGVWIEEVGEKCKKIQEMRAKGSIEVEPSLHQAISTPLPPSTPQSPTDDTPGVIFPPPSHEFLEVGTMHNEGSELDGKINAFPTMPSIIISAA